MTNHGFDASKAAYVYHLISHDSHSTDVDWFTYIPEKNLFILAEVKHKNCNWSIEGLWPLKQLLNSLDAPAILVSLEIVNDQDCLVLDGRIGSNGHYKATKNAWFDVDELKIKNVEWNDKVDDSVKKTHFIGYPFEFLRKKLSGEL